MRDAAEWRVVGSARYGYNVRCYWAGEPLLWWPCNFINKDTAQRVCDKLNARIGIRKQEA